MMLLAAEDYHRKGSPLTRCYTYGVTRCAGMPLRSRILVAVLVLACFVFLVRVPAAPSNMTEGPPSIEGEGEDHQDEGSPSSSLNVLTLNRPEYTAAVVSVGTIAFPMMDPKKSCAVSIAFVPVVPSQTHPSLTVIPSHIDSAYDSDPASSARAVLAAYEASQQAGSDPAPTLSFAGIVEAIKHFSIELLMIHLDRQEDYTALSSTVQKLADLPVDRLVTKLQMDDKDAQRQQPDQASNALCKDWWPLMRQAGYVFEGLVPTKPDATEETYRVPGLATQNELDTHCQKLKLGEPAPTPVVGDSFHAYWRAEDVFSNAPGGHDSMEAYQYPRVDQAIPLAPEGYAHCEDDE